MIDKHIYAGIKVCLYLNSRRNNVALLDIKVARNGPVNNPEVGVLVISKKIGQDNIELDFSKLVCGRYWLKTIVYPELNFGLI